ncbi:MAG: divalent-cation tolerance protein CutA [Candidatus Omnitrophota bacterium]
MPGIVVLTALPDLRTAQSIARMLVAKKLAACVSLGKGFRAVYRWKGRIESAVETQLFIKTTRKKFEPVKRAIRAAHPYELPEIIALPIVQGSSEYLEWLNGSLR